ncbi:MAG TPA: hypothetical protein VG673_10325 [Actinomycetota bacterium]|nr:hypothetical protein [Actinomycetota bacterium]
MAAIYGLVDLVTSWDVFRDQDLIESDFWFITLFTLCLLPDVLNIGLRRRWGLWPLVVFLAGAAAIGDGDADTGMRAQRGADTGCPTAWYGGCGDAPLDPGRGPARWATDASSPALVTKRTPKEGTPSREVTWESGKSA